MADRTATVTWHGTLPDGEGTITSGSGALSDLPVTWASRVEAPGGKTSPEELLAASEAECYTMVLTNMLSTQGNVPDEIQTRVTCTVERQESGLKITAMRLQVGGKVPGLADDAFKKAAQEANEKCPVSNALRGNVDITVEAQLG
jgi:osmotically inducible protein OsmC